MQRNMKTWKNIHSNKEKLTGFSCILRILQYFQPQIICGEKCEIVTVGKSFMRDEFLQLIFHLKVALFCKAVFVSET